MDVTGAGRPSTGETRMAGAEDPGLVANRPASREEAENSRQLVAEVRNPPARLTIAQRANAIIVTDERGRLAHVPCRRPRVVHAARCRARRDRVVGWDGGRLDHPLQGRAGPRGPVHGVAPGQPPAARGPGRVARARRPRHRRQGLRTRERRRAAARGGRTSRARAATGTAGDSAALAAARRGRARLRAPDRYGPADGAGRSRPAPRRPISIRHPAPN